MALVSFSGTSRRLAWVSCSSTALRRLFLVGSDSANQSTTQCREQGGLRAGRPSSRRPSRQLSSCCILPLNVQLDGGRTCRAWIESMEGGHCSNLFELASGNKGAWPARSVSRAIRATPSKSRTWAATCLRHFSGLGRKLCRQPDRSGPLRGRTDFFRLYYSGY